MQTISEIYFGFQLIESTRQRCGGILNNCVVVYRMTTILVGPSRVISGIKLDIYWETIYKGHNYIDHLYKQYQNGENKHTGDSLTLR